MTLENSKNQFTDEIAWAAVALAPAARSTVCSADSSLSQHFVDEDVIHQLFHSDNEEVNAVTSVNTIGCLIYT